MKIEFSRSSEGNVLITKDTILISSLNIGDAYSTNVQIEGPYNKLPKWEIKIFVDENIIHNSEIFATDEIWVNGVRYSGALTSLDEYLEAEIYYLPETGGGGGVALGESASTAYRGDRGKAAYDHSQATGNPHGTVPGDIPGFNAAALAAAPAETPAGIKTKLETLTTTSRLNASAIDGLGSLATQSGTFSGTSSGTNTGDQDLSGKANASHTHVPGDITGFNAAALAAAPPTTSASSLTTGTLSNARLNIAVTDNLKNVKTIAAWGDSMTNMELFTYTVSPFTSHLQALTGMVIYNMGVGGETSTQVKDRMIADTAKLPYNQIFWVGRNDMTSSSTNGATVKANIASMIAALGHTRYLVVGVLNKDTEPNANATRNAIITLNSDLATLYGNKFFDARTYLMTQGTGAGQDATDVTNGVIPTSLRFDGTHLNSSGYEKVAAQLYAKLSEFDDATISPSIVTGAASTATSPIGLLEMNVARLGRYRIGGTQVVFLPDQASFVGSMAFGTGGRNLSRTTGSEGYANIVIGIQAAEALTTAYNNISIGRFSLNVATTAQDNIAIGTGSGALMVSAKKNIAIGTSTLAANTGDNNTHVGYNAGLLQTSGNHNVAVGLQASRANLTGIQITSVGANALFSSTGTGNTAIGYQAGFNLVTGTFNVAVGNATLTGASGSNVSNCTAIGQRALFAVATNGNNNIAVGFQAGDALTTGAKNIVIAYDGELESNTASNQINIGNVIWGQGASATGTSKAGTIGINISPLTTATLALPAGTTGVAPVNIPDGVAPTSPVNGDVWFVGDVMYRRQAGATKSLTFT